MGDDGGAEWRELKTNSGESSCEMWDRKDFFQGASERERWWVVVDMVRSRLERRTNDLNAILAV